MKIKAIERLPRWRTIPGITKADYRALQASKVVDVPDKTAELMISHGYAAKPLTIPVNTNTDEE